MCCMEDEGAKKERVLHFSNYIKLLICMLIQCTQTAFKHPHLRTEKSSLSRHCSAWKWGALQNEMCFALFLLFAAPIIPQIKHLLPKVTGALSCARESFRNAHSQSSRVILLSLQFQKPDLQLPKISSGLKFTQKDYIKHSHQATVLKAEAYSATLFWSEVNKNILIHFYPSLVCINQTEMTCTYLLKNSFFQDKQLFLLPLNTTEKKRKVSKEQGLKSSFICGNVYFIGIKWKRMPMLL